MVRASVRTSQALVEIPSSAAAASIAFFSDSGSLSVMRPECSSPGATWTVSGGLLHDDHELGLAAREANLDPSGAELAADLQCRLAEEVEEAKVECRAEGLDQPLRGLRDRLVPEAGGVGEVLLDRLDVAVELHCDITMTSPSLSCQVTSDISVLPS